MQSYSIIANNLVLDTFNDYDISLNYQIDDILDISKRNTSYSKTIVLPSSPSNNLFFSQVFDVNIDNITFNPLVRIPCIIRIGDNEIFKGNMQLMNISINNRDITYEVTIFGILKDIISEFEEYDLTSLDLSEFNHIRSKANIASSWDYTIYQWGNEVTWGPQGIGYVYPYIVNGNSTDIWNTAYIYDLTPSLYVKTIIDKLFQFVGYTYTSNFFNSSYFKKLILPFIGDKIQMPAETFNERIVKAGVDASTSYSLLTPYQINDSDWYYNNFNNYYLGLTRESGTVDDLNIELTFTDELGQWDGSIFTCQNTGRYDIDFDGKLIPVVIHIDGNDIEYQQGEFEYRYELILIKNNGSQIPLDSSVTGNNGIWGVELFGLSDGEHPSPWYDIENPLLFSVSAEDVLLEEGDRVVIRFGFRYPDTVKFVGNDNKHIVALTLKQSLDESYTKMVITPSSNDSMGNELIDMNQILPSIKMKDFFLDIIKMFNLVVYDNPDKPNDLIIEPKDDFFSSRQKIKDWDEKLDNSRDVKITPMSELDSRRFVFSYSSDDDFYNKEYTSETNRVYGDLIIDTLNEFSSDDEKIEVKFSPTCNASKGIDSKVAPFFIEYSNNQIKPKKVKPRILFYDGKKSMYSGATFSLYDFYQESNPFVYTTYPYCGMWDDPYNPTYSLEFGRPQKFYWDSSVYPNSNLFEQFWKNTIKDIVDINSRLFEGSFHLTPKDIAEFDFRDIIFLKGSYWRVNKIKDYNPVGSDSLTKVVLYKLNNYSPIAPYSLSAPINNVGCPSGIVVSLNQKRNYYKTLNGEPIGEDCCRSIGGNYVDGICYVKERIQNNNDDYGIAKPIDFDSLIVPTSEKDGPQVFKQDGNTINTFGITVIGKNNYVGGDMQKNIIIGDNNSLNKGVKNSLVIGDNINAIESNTIYLNNIKIDQEGNILTNGLTVIDGGLDVVFPLDKTNYIDLIDGTIDAVRNIGGDSKGRPIISGNEEVANS